MPNTLIAYNRVEINQDVNRVSYECYVHFDVCAKSNITHLPNWKATQHFVSSWLQNITCSCNIVDKVGYHNVDHKKKQSVVM